MLTIDTSELDDYLKTLKAFPKELEKVASRSINKSLTSTRAFMVKKVREDYAIMAKEVRSSLEIKKSNWGRLSGHVRGSGSPGIPLVSFARTKKSPSTRRLKSGAYRPLTGIPVIVRKSRGKLPADGVFLATMKSGHVGAFKLKGDGKTIEEKYGPSPIRILSSDRYDKKIEIFAGEAMQKNLLNDAEFVLKKNGATVTRECTPDG